MLLLFVGGCRDALAVIRLCCFDPLLVECLTMTLGCSSRHVGCMATGLHPRTQCSHWSMLSVLAVCKHCWRDTECALLPSDCTLHDLATGRLAELTWTAGKSVSQSVNRSAGSAVDCCTQRLSVMSPIWYCIDTQKSTVTEWHMASRAVHMSQCTTVQYSAAAAAADTSRRLLVSGFHVVQQGVDRCCCRHQQPTRRAAT